jgi:transcriptional regulator with XRE-family HTH domain
MTADSHHPSIPARRLAERLRDLREQEHLTQKQLARVLGGSGALSIATVSLWEKPGSGRLPPPPRLAAYARLFCTSRSFASGTPRLLRDEDLTEQERERDAELHAELLELRERAQSTGGSPASGDKPSDEQHSSIWHFPDGDAVSIVCADAPNPPPWADPSHPNYTRHARHADLDALIEVFGQVRAENPESLIRILAPGELSQDFTLNHLIIVGGAAWREVHGTTPWFAQGVHLPAVEETGETYILKCSVGEEERQFESLYDDNGVLEKDVGVLARADHPIISNKTVTVLSGITSRGVHGAALGFIKPYIREDNENFLKDTFGNCDAFCIVMRITVSNSAALPPNLRGDDVCLYEWSTETGARWGAPKVR